MTFKFNKSPWVRKGFQPFSSFHVIVILKDTSKICFLKGPIVSAIICMIILA